jgi:5'-3' exonuclease
MALWAGLATHEAHFTVLREEVVFGQRKEKTCFRCGQTGHDVSECTGKARVKKGEHGEFDASPGTVKPLQFLHVFILREYLEIEFEVRVRVVPLRVFGSGASWCCVCIFTISPLRSA